MFSVSKPLVIQCLGVFIMSFVQKRRISIFPHWLIMGGHKIDLTLGHRYQNSEIYILYMLLLLANAESFKVIGNSVYRVSQKFVHTFPMPIKHIRTGQKYKVLVSVCTLDKYACFDNWLRRLETNPFAVSPKIFAHTDFCCSVSCRRLIKGYQLSSSCRGIPCSFCVGFSFD